MNSRIIEEDLNYITNADLPWWLLENKNVLISGAAGFIPTYIVKTLLYLNDKQSKNIKITCIARNKERFLGKFQKFIGRDDFRFIIQDVCEPIQLKENADYIIHAASQASPKYYGIDPAGTLSANTIGTYNLLEYARKSSSEGFLFISTNEVYGLLEDGQIPTKEDYYGYIDPLNIRSCYAESKKMGENMCASWMYQYGINAKIARLYHTYGPDISLDDGRVYADFISDIVNNRDIKMNSKGDATRSFCYIADAVIGLFTVLLKGQNGQAYNIGNDKETSIFELANLLVNMFPEKSLKVITDEKIMQEGYIKSKISRTCPDITKIMLLGWKPRYSVDEGFQRTIRSFQ